MSLRLNNLVGFGAAAIGDTLVEWVLVGTNTGSTSTISISGAGAIAAGDLCLIFNRGSSSSIGSVSTPSAVTPSGFTNLRSVGDNVGSSPGFGVRAMIHAKILLGSETSVTGMNSDGEDWAVAVLRPSLPITSFSDHDTGNSQVTSGNPVAQTINVADEATAALVAYGIMAVSTTGASTVSPSVSPGMSELAPSDFHRAHYAAYGEESARSDISYDMPDEGNLNAIASGYLTFTLS